MFSQSCLDMIIHSKGIKNMSLNLRKNWKNIALVPCEITRAALCYVQDESVFKKLAKAFPECFYESDTPSRVLFSDVLLEAARLSYGSGWSERKESHSLEELMFEQQHTWYMYDISFKLPVVAHWKSERNRPDPVPEVVLKQIRRKNLKGPIFVTYRGQKCVLAEIHCDYHRDWYGRIHNGTYMPRKLSSEDISELTLVSAQSIEFDI
jgi:hypothetical protein